jgi:hypothetical protein
MVNCCWSGSNKCFVMIMAITVRTDRPVSAARAGGEAIEDVLDDVPPFKPSSSSSIFHRSSDITFDSFGDPRSLSPSRHVTSAVKDVADDAASALSDDLDGPNTRAGKRSSEAGKKDDDSAWPPLKAALRRERDSRRDSVASGETDLILDEAERELHCRAGGSSAESDDILGDSSRTSMMMIIVHVFNKAFYINLWIY